MNDNDKNNVIEFPKNNILKISELKSKLDVIYKILDYITDYGYDFNVVITKDASKYVIDGNHIDSKENIVLTTGKEEFERFIFSKDDIIGFIINGDELQ